MAGQQRAVVAALLLAVLLGCSAKPPLVSRDDDRRGNDFSEADVLRTLRQASPNWDAATAEIPGFRGWDVGTALCKPGRSQSDWYGIECNLGGLVQKIELVGLGLEGTLPPELFLLASLVSLNLSWNKFKGMLPPQWTSETLIEMDVSNNQLDGPLPVAYGAEATFPKLKWLQLHGNSFTGAMPESYYTGFAAKTVIVLRPGNKDLCGSVPLMDPALYPAGVSSSPMSWLPDLSSAFSAPRYGSASSFVMYLGMLGRGTVGTTKRRANSTLVQITNTLGSCAEPCGRTTMIQTNLFDVAWTKNVTLADLLRYNRYGDAAKYGGVPGTALALPCYYPALTRDQLSSDVARLMFAGGNQAGIDGVVGATLAGSIVRSDSLNATYAGSMEWTPSGANDAQLTLVEPVYWFVDLQSNFSISAVSLTAGSSVMKNVSLRVGGDEVNVLGNKWAAKELEFAPGETKVVTAQHLWGTLVIVYAGYRNQGTMSLGGVRVWAAQANAAVYKPPLASYNAPDLNFTTDGEMDTCTRLGRKDSASGQLWFGVDLTYSGTVAAVVIESRGGSDSTRLNVYVTEERVQDIRDVNLPACGYNLTLVKGERQLGTACQAQGRYVVVEIKGIEELNICELEVFLEAGPETTPATLTGLSSAEEVGLGVGCTLGALLAIAAAAGGFVCVRRRRRRRVQLAADNGSGSTDEASTLESGDVKVKQQRSDSATTANGGMARFKEGMEWPQKQDSPASGSWSEHNSPKLAPSDPPPYSTDLSRFGQRCDIVDFSQLELVRTIGEGSFGLVWMGRYLQTTVAIKLLTHDTKRGSESQAPPSEAVMKALQKEASIMASLRHPNVAQYMGACLDPPGLIMEYCSKRSVSCILAAAVADPKQARLLNWVRLLNMATDAAKGLLYLHTRSPPIIHRDLKSPNLLVDALWHVKISDFNLSRAVDADSALSSLTITNPRWLAPEVLQGDTATAASDVFAFGVVLWELMTWQLPWGHDPNPFVIINSVTKGTRLPVPQRDHMPGGPLDCYDEYVRLMLECWEQQPELRPSTSDVAQRLRGMLAQVVKATLDSRAQN